MNTINTDMLNGKTFKFNDERAFHSFINALSNNNIKFTVDAFENTVDIGPEYNAVLLYDKYSIEQLYEYVQNKFKESKWKKISKFIKIKYIFYTIVLFIILYIVYTIGSFFRIDPISNITKVEPMEEVKHTSKFLVSFIYLIIFGALATVVYKFKDTLLPIVTNMVQNIQTYIQERWL